MFNNNVLNKIEYTRNKDKNLWVAHAHHVMTNKHVYATGRTLDLLKKNITQNIANHKMNPRTFIFDEHASDEIYMNAASDMFMKRINNEEKQNAQGLIKKEDVCTKTKDDNIPEVIIKEVDGVIIVYTVKEIARYKKADCIL